MNQAYTNSQGQEQEKKIRDPFLSDKQAEKQSEWTEDLSRPAPSPAFKTEGEKDIIPPIVSAGFWIRVLSFLIDTLLGSAFAKIFASPLIALLHWTDSWVSGGIIGFFYLSYFVLSTKITNGQSLGKMITGLRVIHQKEENLSWTTVIVREFFCRLVSNTLPLIYLLVAFTPLHQGLADFVCDTYVVKENLYRIEQAQPGLLYQSI